MKLKLFISILFTVIFISACAVPNNEPDITPTRNEPLSLMKLSTKGMTDQQPAMNAKNILSEDETIARVRAVNFENDLLVAIEVNNFQRFRLKQIEEKVRKKINNKYKNFDIIVVSDAKLVSELKQLEEAIEQNNISDDELRQKINDLKKLSTEQT